MSGRKRDLTDAQLRKMIRDAHVAQEELDRRADKRFTDSIPSYRREVKAAYAEGFKIGLEWPDIWETHGKPGGPWTGSSDEKQRRLRADINAAWRRGWEAGHQEKLKTGRSNPPRRAST